MAFIGNTNTTQAFTPAIDYFSGNGSTTAFTLSRPVASVAQVEVVIDNVVQNPSSAYTVSSNTITFTSAPLSGTNNIYVRYTSPITQVIAPGQGTVTSDSFGTITNFTTTGNTVLGDATTDTLTVGVTGIVKDSSGNVGIGTSSPVVKLEVKASSGAGEIRVDSSAGDILQLQSSATESRIGSISAVPLAFRTSNVEAMRIDSSGNLNIASSASNGAYVNIWCGDNSRNGLNVQVFSNGNNAVGFKNVSGTQVGSITVNASTTAYNTSSDYRLKENIASMTGALSVVSQLKPVTYKWKSDGSNGEGFIAHELAEIKPDCVTGEKDAVDDEGNPKYQGIDTSFLVATLTAALQETKALIDQQAETINALTARIEALENR